MNYSIVVGATGGMGKFACQTLAKSGTNLYLTARSQEKLELLKLELLESYPNLKITCFACDLQKYSSVKALFAHFLTLNAKVNGIYFFNGVDIQKPFENYTYDKIVMQARVNYESVLLLTKFALTNKANDLKILVTSSLCGITPIPYFAEYSSLKSALISFFTSLRYEYKNKGVKITILAPGSVPTRPDVINDIKLQGLQGKLSSKPPQIVVNKAFKALQKNKRLCIVGFYNKTVYLFSKITPLKLKQKILAKKFLKKEKDAF